MYAYSKLMADRNNFWDSTEGMTYIQQRMETRIQSKIISCLYQDTSREKALKKWRYKVDVITTSTKLHEHDQAAQSYIDVDQLLELYLKEFQEVRREKQNELRSLFRLMQQANTASHKSINIRDVIDAFVTKRENIKYPVPNLVFPKQFTLIRCFIYALVCGQNTGEVPIEQFMAACNRFGVDSPIPVTTKRLALYGNQEDIDKDFRKMVDRYKDQMELDPEILGAQDFKENNFQMFGGMDSDFKKKNIKDFKESKPHSPVKKMSTLMNI